MADTWHFPVSPAKAKALQEWMTRLGIREAECEEQFVRSMGRGGQKVNKSSTCVLLTHRPSGMAVKCQEARTQAMNRFYARRRLCEKMDAQIRGRASAAQQQREKTRRQKRRRSRRAKEKMLAAKKRQSMKKAGRRRSSGITTE